jgi:hypothetical protein
MGPLEVAVTDVWGHAALRDRILEPYQPARLELWPKEEDLMFCWPCITVYQYSDWPCITVYQYSDWPCITVYQYSDWPCITVYQYSDWPCIAVYQYSDWLCITVYQYSDWPCITAYQYSDWQCITVYQYNENNVIHFSFNLLRIKGPLYVSSFTC